MEHHSVQADLITMARAWAAACRSRAWWAAPTSWTPAAAGLGGTYAGNPLAVAARARVLDVIAEEKLCERAVQLGDKLRAHLEGLRAKVPGIADVRGLGSMVALELNDPATGKPDADAVAQARAMERGLILLSCGVYGNVLRFLYPLTIPDAQFARALTSCPRRWQHKHRRDHPAGGASPKGLSPPRPDIRLSAPSCHPHASETAVPSGCRGSGPPVRQHAP